MLQTPQYLSPGDSAPAFMGKDQAGNDCILYGMAGTPVMLLFFPNIHIEKYRELLIAMTARYAAFTQAGAEIMAITLNTHDEMVAFATQHMIPFPLLSVTQLVSRQGKELHVLREYNIIQPAITDTGKWHFIPTIMLIDYNSRIRKYYSLAMSFPTVDGLLADINSLMPRRETRVVHSQAPVLFIDNVLSNEECQTLIHVWDEQGNVDSGSMKTIDGKTVGVYNYDTKIRRDHFIKDTALLQSLDVIMRRRIFPQIKKAFNFECTRREDYKIACYDAGRGGYFRKHRDNTTAGTAHRIWAMSLNLNADAYEGGYVRFPEYSDYCYKPHTGSALIFSGSMMHEATDVYNGKRFVLLQFFYGEAQARVRRENSHLLVG